MKLSQIRVDHNRLEQGAWVDSIPEMGGLRLKVRGFGNADDRRIQARELEAIPRAKRASGRVDVGEVDRVLGVRLLDAILLDWDGLTDENDAPIPYSREMAARLIQEADYRPFRDAVVWAATYVAESRAEDTEGVTKNS